MPASVAESVSAFGLAVGGKLGNPAIKGAPEDQLRAPLETLLKALASIAGQQDNTLELVGETTLSSNNTRPDFAATLNNVLVGFIEVKAPGKGADPRTFSDAHDKRQWEKLRSLPNLIYTDGQSFSLWQDGKIVGQAVTLAGDLKTAGGKLAAPPTLLPLVTNFLNWAPIAPRNAARLAEMSARLCRLLRDEVTEQLALKNPGLKDLADEWRGLLFPQADDEKFADGYAQAVTFGLLVARARDIPLTNGVGPAALELLKSNSLIGAALRLLTDNAQVRKSLETSLGALTRVLDVVNWHDVGKDDPDAWLYFYEEFLRVYDKDLRKATGSYYTPPEVVAAMARLVDEALKDAELFDLPAGLASPKVKVADPAVGTGTFLLGVMQRIARTVEADQGAGAVGPALAAAANRLIGFEMQFGPFAVAQLRLLAEMQAYVGSKGGTGANLPVPRLFVTDTLGDPYAEQTKFSSMLAPIGESRKAANAAKRDEAITVVIGNPPYKEKARGRGGWVEAGSPGRPTPMAWWTPPSEWGASAHTKHLKNLYVFFWRWAALKVFGTGWHAATGEPEPDRSGIVCFITVAGFLNGPGFQKMRDDLRRTASAIWVIDCSPEGHQPPVGSRIFQGVQQPVCIVLAARRTGEDGTMPARVRFRALPKGRRAEKFKDLETIGLADDGWVDAPSGWREPFMPEPTGEWADFPSLTSFFAYDGSGVMPGRTWVIAPDAWSLKQRWRTLQREEGTARRALLFYPHLRRGQPGDKHLNKTVAAGLTGHEQRLLSVANDLEDVVEPTRYGFRSFDRQWIIPDARLINQPNPTLWDSHSFGQVYLTAPDDRSPSSGPALTISSLVPDLHHYNGRGGRVFPLWHDRAGRVPNVRPELLELLAESLGELSAEDVFAYLAAVLAHPAFTERFRADLVQPGLRVPMTADPALFAEAAELGREVIWLHSYGERFADAAAGRPKGAPRLPEHERPTVTKKGTIPPAPEPLPEAMRYVAAERRLWIGKGFVDNVSPAMCAYEVSGKNVLDQWFSYRRRDRSKPPMGDRRPPSPLSDIQPDGWLAEYTTDLLDLLNVLGRVAALEPRQAALLDRILAGRLIDRALIAEALGDETGAG